MKKKPYGLCALCGKEDNLTEEHIPPQSAFNKGVIYAFDLLMNVGTDECYWNKTGEKYKIFQNGVKIYSLCATCNNNTGSWYGNQYAEFLKQLTPPLTIHKGQPNEVFKGLIKDVYPLRVIKQILSMFCSMNSDYHELSSIRQFVNCKEMFLNESKKPRYRLYTYINSSDMYKLIPFQKKITHNLDFTKIHSVDAFLK